MRQDATNLLQPTTAIDSRGLWNIPLEISNLLPGREWESLAWDVHHHRQQSRAQAHHLGSIARTIEGNDFLRVDEDDLKIFAADVGLEFISECDHWFTDGTFRVTPKCIPCTVLRMAVLYHVYALLSGRSEEIYINFENPAFSTEKWSKSCFNHDWFWISCNKCNEARHFQMSRHNIKLYVPFWPMRSSTSSSTQSLVSPCNVFKRMIGVVWNTQYQSSDKKLPWW